MFISRREWEDKCDENRKLLANKAEKEILIEELKGEINRLEKHNIALQEELQHKDQTLNFQRERVTDLGKDNNLLMTANQNLTDWVSKIINEVGIYDVEDKKSVVIPIYRKNRRVTASTNLEEFKSNVGEFLNTEEIIIPEIRFVRMK